MLRNLNILVVDDEQIVLDSVEKHLGKEANYNIHTALTARDALDLIENVSIDIVLTDLMMPEKDGLELTRSIQDIDPDIPVIMITGYATINTALQAMQLGAFDYVAKPFSKAELKGVVARAAELVYASDETLIGTGVENAESSWKGKKFAVAMKSMGEHTWLTMEKDGYVRLGVEHLFLSTIGHVQTVHLPEKGEVLRQGSVMVQFFTTDFRSHYLLSPLSGEVVEVNDLLVNDLALALEDPYEKGWMIRLDPSNFDAEVKVLGL